MLYLQGRKPCGNEGEGMTDEELAKIKSAEFTDERGIEYFSYRAGFLAGLKEGRPKWRNIFTKGEPYAYEYWDIPQDNLPNENFYFVKLKNGFIKICELKYDPWSKKKYFYDLHGGKQSDVAEWLDYPEITEENNNGM